MNNNNDGNNNNISCEIVNDKSFSLRHKIYGLERQEEERTVVVKIWMMNLSNHHRKLTIVNITAVANIILQRDEDGKDGSGEHCIASPSLVGVSLVASSIIIIDIQWEFLQE